MRQLSIIVIALSTMIAAPVAAEPRVKLESPLNLGDQDKEWCNASPEDSMIMTVTNGAEPPVIQKVCSSYGSAKGFGFTDKKGRNYVLLEYGVGRGTNERDDYLRVYQLEKNNLFKIMDIQLSWKTHPDDRFRYTYEVTGGTTQGLQINLREVQSTAGPDVIEPPIDEECCIPSARTRSIWIDPEQ
jgi:hypothetical protein